MLTTIPWCEKTKAFLRDKKVKNPEYVDVFEKVVGEEAWYAFPDSKLDACNFGGLYMLRFCLWLNSWVVRNNQTSETNQDMLCKLMKFINVAMQLGVVCFGSYFHLYYPLGTLLRILIIHVHTFHSQDSEYWIEAVIFTVWFSTIKKWLET